MKYQILSATRTLGLLPAFDRMAFLGKTARKARDNRTFRARHPDFALPPPDLAFDAYNKVDWTDYHDTGLKHAQMFADLVLRHSPVASNLKLLEWGCGPGRLIRHMPDLLAERTPWVIGTDYNPETIGWCRQQLDGIDFALNDIAPPLPFVAESFDVIYNFSVFTHLSAEMHDAWMSELLRVLKPGGLLILTTHGDRHRYLLTREAERAAYDRGELVTQAQYQEGKKWYFAIHPPAYVRNELLRDFERIEQMPPDPEAAMSQDVWLAFKPHD